MRIKKIGGYVCGFFTFAIFISAAAFETKAAGELPARGVWVTCFTKKEVLHSKENIHKLIKDCRDGNINQVYLQFYRADEAYYDSTVTDDSPYEAIKGRAGFDSVNYLIDACAKENIEVFAWINTLSLSTNLKANVLAKLGQSALTRDQHLRPSYRKDSPDKTDKYYWRENQYFLEAADPRVRSYILNIIKEITATYPDLSGVHLDYIRYPQPVPFIPGSRFNDVGLTYGYGERSLEIFQKRFGFDPRQTRERSQLETWDNWKRSAVTEIVRGTSLYLKNQFPKMKLSCAVLPSVERAYHAAFQDWVSWLDQGIIDYAVLMNYTTDHKWAEYAARQALALAPSRVYIGIGSYLFDDNADMLKKQYQHLSDLNPAGIVFFSYDTFDAAQMN